MKHEKTLAHEFVEYIPNDLKEGMIYVSVAFATAAHRCCCGCGKEVITPLSPTDWKLIFDGVSITLDPSIGNWSFPCQSHYWIRHNRVKWAGHWSQAEISAGRTHDSMAKGEYFGAAKTPAASAASASASGPADSKPKEGVWQRLKKWFLGK
jgi:hypothetical protein